MDPFWHELERHPQKFAILSGHLDAIAAMKKHAEQVLEVERDEVKEVSHSCISHIPDSMKSPLS